MTVVDNAHLEVTRFLILVIANASRGSVLLSMLMSQIGFLEVLNVGGLEHSAIQQGPTPRVFPDTMGMVSQ